MISLSVAVFKRSVIISMNVASVFEYISNVITPYRFIYVYERALNTGLFNLSNVCYKIHQKINNFLV